MEVQRVYDATTSTRDTPAGMPPLHTGAYTGVVVNGIFYGTGRIISFRNPTSADITENGRHLWKQIVNVEVTTTGDATNIGSNRSMTGLRDAYHPQLVSLDENFGFNVSAEGDYQYTHTASVKCYNEPSGAGVSGYITARRIASGLLESTPPFGYIDSVHSGMYTGAGQRFYTETTDTFNGTAAFEERLLIQNRDFMKHNVSFENGYVNITENGLIRHSGITGAGNIFNGDPNGLITNLNRMLGGAYTRCNSLWTTYSGILGVDAYSHSLAVQPVQITKAFDESSQELNYVIVFTNNGNMTTQGYTIEREQVLNITDAGNTEASEQGSIVAYIPKNTSLKDTLLTAVTGEMTGAYNRLLGLWASLSTCKQVAENKMISLRGKRAGYSVAFSNDPSFINDGTFLTKSLSIVDNGVVRMHTPYFILGRATPLVHDPGQSQFGSVSCTINATLVRPANYYAANPVKPTALNQMFVDSVNNMLSAISLHTPIDMFVTRVAYTYTSELTVELTTEAQYSLARTTRI